MKRKISLRDSFSSEKENNENNAADALQIAGSLTAMKNEMVQLKNALVRLTEEVFALRQEIKRLRTREDSAEESIASEEELLA